MSILVQHSRAPEGITNPDDEMSKWICHILRCSLKGNPTGRGFVHQGVLLHHHVMPLMSARKFSSGGSQAKQKGKQSTTHLYLTFVPYHFWVKAKTSFQQLPAPASAKEGRESWLQMKVNEAHPSVPGSWGVPVPSWRDQAGHRAAFAQQQCCDIICIVVLQLKLLGEKLAQY